MDRVRICSGPTGFCGDTRCEVAKGDVASPALAPDGTVWADGDRYCAARPTVQREGMAMDMGRTTMQERPKDDLRPPEDDAPGPAAGTGGVSRWVLLLVALVLGGLVGYLLGWATGPSETQTLTTTVTETAPAPAYTTSSEFQAQVAFDGTNCLYSGPTEVRAGARATFAYTAMLRESTLLIWRVSPGITYEQVLKAHERSVSDPPAYLERYENSEPADARQQTLRMPLEEGIWVVSCAMNPDTSTGDIVFGTMLRSVRP
jgi:hypothetical protein